MRRFLYPALIIFAALLGGCALGRYRVNIDGKSKSIRCETLERFYFTLENDGEDGFKWIGKSDDPDAELQMDRDPKTGKVEVRIRILGGFDGPAHVHFAYHNAKSKETREDFTLLFYHDINDRAFWK